MDGMLRPGSSPGEPVVTPSNVRLAARQRWDGGTFLKYPIRRGYPDAYFGGSGTTGHPWEIRQTSVPTAELEVFFQEWLFFGLIVEALDGNSETTSLSHLPMSEDVTVEAAREDSHSPVESLTTLSKRQAIIAQVYIKFVTQADSEPAYITAQRLLDELHNSWAISLLSFLSSAQDLKVRCKRMRLCLRKAHYFYNHLPADFSPDIRFSIGAVAETIAKVMQPVCYWLKLDEICPDQWGHGYYQWTEVRSRMLDAGWCRSEFVRTVNKFKSLHSLHYLSFLDKKKPAMDHAGCDDMRCVATVGKGRPHWKEDCGCKEIEVDQTEVMSVLRAGDAIPLLRFEEPDVSSGDGARDVPNVTINVVSSAGSVPYIAISHIWSDGLGNEYANSLNACKLRKLRRMVHALPPLATGPGAAKTELTYDSQSAQEEADCPLIWLDTLCCPVDAEDKNVALAKMRQVYEQASSVLVLDASLQSYSTASMDTLEVLSRIFTCRWLRRVWTLQEGALAKDLWFQFADKAVSLAELKTTMEAIWPDDLQQKFVFFDIRYEIDRIEQFFQTSGYDGSGPNLKVLDEALLHRGITDPSDEPLCIGTLMNLPAEDILASGSGVNKALQPPNSPEGDDRRALQLQLRNRRMETVWKLLAAKFSSLPAQIIFFEEARLEVEGFRWAPQSLLDDQKVYLDARLRRVRWDDDNPGTLTAKGLRVKFPGYRLYLAQYDDGKPRHPWRGRKRPPEEGIVFRDAKSGDWWSVTTKERAKHVRDVSATLPNPSEFPLHDFIHQYGGKGSGDKEGTTSDKGFLLMSQIDHGETPHSEKNAVDGLLVVGTSRQERFSTTHAKRKTTTQSKDAANNTTQRESVWDMSIRALATELLTLVKPFPSVFFNILISISTYLKTTTLPPPLHNTITAKTTHHVIVGPLPTALSNLYNTSERLALQLRNERCTDDLLDAYDTISIPPGSSTSSSQPEDDEIYKSKLRLVEQRMKDLMRAALDQDEDLRTGMRKTWGDDIDEYLWVFIGDWFQHSFLGEKVGDGEEQGGWWTVD